MIYVDTSALVPVFIRESKSEAVIGWLESSGERLAISEWSLVEFASATAIKVRTGQAAANLVKRATERVREFAQKHGTIAERKEPSRYFRVSVNVIQKRKRTNNQPSVNTLRPAKNDSRKLPPCFCSDGQRALNLWNRSSAH